jgi:hypothetical protein
MAPQGQRPEDVGEDLPDSTRKDKDKDKDKDKGWGKKVVGNGTENHKPGKM